MSEEVTEPVVPEPVVESVEESTTTTYDWADEATQQRATEAFQRMEEWGDPDTVKTALEINQALQTDEGITQLFIQAGKSLGLGLDKLEALFGETETTQATVEEVAAPWADPDHVPTGAEIEAYFSQQIESRLAEVQRQQQATSEQERQLNTARSATQSTLDELKVTNENEVRQVLALAQSHISDNDLNPDHIKAAIRKGYADYEKGINEAAKRYLDKKRSDTEGLPGSITGGSPGGETLPEPKNVEEARARVRKRLGIGR